MKLAAALLLGLALLGPALAQNTTVWRCGSDGRVYSDSPCPGGRELQVADARSAQQRQEAVEVAARDQAMARRLADERREREREYAARGPGLIALGPVSTPAQGVKPTKRPSAKKKQTAQPERSKPQDFAARGTSPSAAHGSRRKTG